MKEIIALTDIINFLGSEVKTVYGNPIGVNIQDLKDPENVDKHTLDWISAQKKEKQQIAENSKAKAILVSHDLEYSDKLIQQGKVLLVVDNPKLSLAKVGNKFFVNKLSPGIHPTAIIDSEAQIGQEVFIGAYVVLGKCKIGDNCTIYPNVVIYDRTIIGDNVSIHSGAVICVDGLGCLRMTDGELFEFPQLGGVIIEDNVYIGANTQIASGALSNTIIGKGSKINGLSFIGSNCKLMENVWITGSTMLAGSVQIGKNSTIFSNVIIRNQCVIGESVIVGMGSVVTKNIPNNETWMGNPAKINKYE
jgi:UDP-3-O-[3-hydroxymyristoyl] glucosamine N-acyltransferase